MLAWYRIVACPRDLLLHRPAVPPAADGVTIVHPGAQQPARRWPVDRFARLARQLHADGHDVVVTGSPAETGLAGRVAGLAGLPADRVLAGRTDVGALAALVSRARLVVCGDTGIGHLATGYGTPSVLLFGPTPPSHWGPGVDLDRHRVLWHGERVPAGRRPARSRRALPDPALAAIPDPALAAISVDEVLAEVRALSPPIRAPAP
jgi:ADP-heptose:LPS heptosyltransferase